MIQIGNLSYFTTFGQGEKGGLLRMYLHTLGREEWSLEKYFASVSDGTPVGEGAMPSTLPLGPQSQEGEIAKEFLE